jgi:hypothetical protein
MPDPREIRDEDKGPGSPEQQAIALLEYAGGFERRCPQAAADVLTSYMKGGMKEIRTEAGGSIIDH